MLKKIFTGICAFGVICTFAVYLIYYQPFESSISTDPHNKRMQVPQKIEVSFFLNIDRQRDYWIGDLLNFYSKDGKLLAVLAKHAGVQTATFTNPHTLSLDLTDTPFVNNPIKKTDLIDLGRPGGNSVYLGFAGGVLYAHAFGKFYSKDKLDAPWKECGSQESRSNFSFPHFQKCSSPLFQRFIGSQSRKDEFFTPIFLGSSRILINREKTGLSDCVFNGSAFSCRKILNSSCPYIYVYDVYGEMVDLYCANGDKYKYNLLTNELARTVAATKVGVSNQFYSSLVINDQMYFGQYPSGGLLVKSDFGENMASLPPLENPKKPLMRELQSIAFIGGKVLAGIWPWGELWEGEIDGVGVKFHQSIRLFDPIEGEDDKDHPGEGMLPSPYDINELGQRISTIIPCWNGVCISTSSKWEKISPSEHINNKVLDQYGRVYYLAGPKSNCSTDAVSSGYFSLILNRNGYAVLLRDKEIICQFSFSSQDLAKVIDETFKVSVGSNFGSKNGHSGQVNLFLRN